MARLQQTLNGTLLHFRQLINHHKEEADGSSKMDRLQQTLNGTLLRLNRLINNHKEADGSSKMDRPHSINGRIPSSILHSKEVNGTIFSPLFLVD